ncbi:MAG: carbohydrate kinase family protein [Nanoarchaeota archaeon]
MIKRWVLIAKYDVVTIGSATIDVFANTNSQLVKFITPDGENDFITYPSGSKMLISQLDFLVGGGGTNTAVSFSRLGLKTGFLGKLGDDENATKILDILTSESVDYLGTRGGQTGYSIILNSIEHDRTILTFKGANDSFSKEEFEKTGFPDTTWLYSSSMVGESFYTLKDIFMQARQRNVRIAFNPSSYQAKKGLDELSELLGVCDVIILNHEEAQLLLDTTGTAKELSMKLQRYEGQYILITQGSKGVTCYHKNKLYHLDTTPHVPVVETTGAGDAFASGFVAGLAKNFTLPDSLKLGMVQAEGVIRARGPKRSLLTYPEAQRRMQDFKGILHKINVKTTTTSTKGRLAGDELPAFHFHAPEGKSFRLSDNTLISSMDELAEAFTRMSDEEFAHHVSTSHDHFADWIEHVFKLKELANILREAPTKQLHRAILRTYVTYSKR